MNPRFRKFLSYYRPHLKLFFADLFCAFVLAAIALVFPLCIRYITKNILEAGVNDALAQIYQVGAVMLVLVIIQGFCDYFVGYRGHTMGAMMESDMRSELFAHYQKLSFHFYDSRRTGQLMSRLTNDLLSLAELYHHGPEDIVIFSMKFIGAFIILMQINAKLTLTVGLFLPFLVVFVLYFNKKLHRSFKQNKARVADINAQVEDNLAGIRAVKSFANEETEKKKFEYENSRFLKSRNESYQSESILFEGANAITQLISAVVVVFGGVAIVGATLDLADLLTFMLYISFLIEPIKGLVNMTRLYQEGFTGFERFMEILEIEPDIQDAENAIALSQVQGCVEFRQVNFRYQEEQDAVLENISLEVKAGETVALVGMSGAGKSTLCSLIPRFYEVSEGQVLLDGIDVKDIQLHSLRKNIGVVQQDIYLFSGTVLENIAYGKADASEAEIVEAAKKANAHDFIMQLPNGYHTDIGQRGVKISGGQKQRLSIARVFLKNPPVLIFDEATSALDNESEQVIQQSLKDLSKDRTTIIIAHRLSTIRHAKRIVVLTEHGIGEQGTHEELLEKDGVYSRLYQMQFEG